MYFKEELREGGYSEGDIAEAIRKAAETVEAEKARPDLERIKKEHTARRGNSSIVVEGG